MRGEKKRKRERERERERLRTLYEVTVKPTRRNIITRGQRNSFALFPINSINFS